MELPNISFRHAGKTDCTRRNIAHRSLVCISLFALCLVAAVGCNSSAQSKLAGRWIIDTGEGIQDEMFEESDEMSPKFELEFLSNGNFKTTVVMKAQPSEKNGKWKLELIDGKYTLTTEINGEQNSTKVEFLSENQIKLAPPNMGGLSTAYKFKRIKN